MACDSCSRDLDLWCSKHARLWDKLTIASGKSQTYYSGSNYTPIVGWLWTWKVSETGSALGSVKIRIPGKGVTGTVATSFEMAGTGAIMVPFPVSELTIEASGGDVDAALGAYPVDSAHAAGMFSSNVESWSVFELDNAGGTAPSKTINVPTGADSFAVFGPSGASDGITVKSADANGNSPYLVTFDQSAIHHGQQTGVPWIPTFPGGSVTINNLANTAEYVTIRWLFRLGTMGR